MIDSSPHPITGRQRTAAACDIPDCIESMYLPGEVGVQHAVTLMQDLGWTIAGRAHPAGYAYAALCPTHGGS